MMEMELKPVDFAAAVVVQEEVEEEAVVGAAHIKQSKDTRAVLPLCLNRPEEHSLTDWEHNIVVDNMDNNVV
jgi:hypothetical protein